MQKDQGSGHTTKTPIPVALLTVASTVTGEVSSVSKLAAWLALSIFIKMLSLPLPNFKDQDQVPPPPLKPRSLYSSGDTGNCSAYSLVT